MDQIVVNLLVYIFFPMCIFAKSKVNLKNQKEELISIEDSMYIRGIAAFFIVFAHLLAEIVETKKIGIGLAYPFTWFGGLGVCIFFFLSGYGLWCSYGRKELSRDFIRKRVGRVIPVFIVLRVLTGWIQIENLDIQNIWQYFLYILGFIKPMWFVVEILLIYLAFFVICKITNRHRIIGMFAFLFLLSAICYAIGLEERWYNSNMLFGIGMLVSQNKSSVKKFLQKKPVLFLLVFGVAFCAFSIGFVMTKGYLVSVLLKVLAGFFLCMFFVVFNFFIDWNGKIIHYAGSNSLEIYLVHQNIWAILTLFDLSIGFTFISTILGTFLMVLLYKHIETRIRGLSEQRRK